MPEVIHLTAELATRTSNTEAAVFWVLGAAALAGGLGVVLAPKAVYSAISLAATMTILAVFYAVQGAVFLGVVQVVVYTGAVMMLFLFVVMLIGVHSSDKLRETLRWQRFGTISASVGFGILLVGAVANHPGIIDADGTRGIAHEGANDNVGGLAALIFSRYLWAFELTGALLITAALGAMVLTHRDHLDVRKSQRELSRERFRLGAHATPMPTPGVYAQHNAVDWAALLPDGSYAESSVSAVLQPRYITATGYPIDSTKRAETP